MKMECGHVQKLTLIQSPIFPFLHMHKKELISIHLALDRPDVSCKLIYGCTP